MPPIDFLAFDLEIGLGDGYTYPVAVLNSPAGEARAEIEWPFSPGELEHWLGELDVARFVDDDQATQLAQEFGARLFNAIMHADIRSRYDVSRQMTRQDGAGLQLKLRINDPELATLPWELLYDPRVEEFIALSRHTPLVRYLEVGQPARPLQVKPPLRILGMIASPAGVAPLDVEAERARIEDALGPLVDKGGVELVWLADPTWRGLQAAMQTGPWHVFHFIGHAQFDDEEEAGAIMVADDNGQATNLSARELARLLTDQRTLRLVNLNACEGARGDEGSLFSSMAATLVARGLPAVLAMQYEISDEAAIEFSRSFYSALANGYPIDAATSEARKTLSLALPTSLEWATPVLFMRAADGILWTVTQKSKRQLSILLLAGLFLIILAFVAVPPIRAALTPAPPPAPMTGKFNIAVARFGELDENGRVQPSADGAELSQWVFAKLTDEFEANKELFGSGDVIKLRLIDAEINDDYTESGTLRGATDEERQASAEYLAGQIKADMVIYGNLTSETDDGISVNGQRLALDFYLNPAFGEEAQQVAGHHAMGDDLLVGSLDGLGSFANAGPLEMRAQALAGLTIGLIYDLLGNHEKALEILVDLDDDLDGWADEQGKELLYYLTGRQQLFLDQLDAAETSARDALTARPGYSRAHVVLGSVFAKRAINEMLATQTPELENTAKALTEYEAAAISAENEGNDLVAQTARTALGAAYLLQGQAASLAGEADTAIAAFDQGLAELETVYGPLAAGGQFRYLAQAHQYAGNAYFLKADVFGRAGDLPGRQKNLEAAQDAFTRCIEQGPNALADETLQDKVIAQICQPMLDVTLDELTKMEATSWHFIAPRPSGSHFC